MKKELPREIKELLKKGVVIPAHPTALTKDLKLDHQRQRALSRYYLDAGVGGVAVGVHTSQFEIRDIGIYEEVLRLASEEIDVFTSKNNKTIIKIAGVLGRSEQAKNEAKMALKHNYHAALISLTALKGQSNQELIAHCKSISEIIPLIGFYLQTAVGGQVLDTDFWREFSKIDNVVAIKMAPFDRYNTLDVIRGVAESGRAGDIALYTGNDDNIIADLLTTYEVPVGDNIISLEIVGGLLGHWAVWTKKAVETFERIKNVNTNDIGKLLTLGAKITDANAAIYDTRNNFVGSIAGVHKILVRQGFLDDITTINPKESLSIGQEEEINRVYSIYPELNDDKFVSDNIDKWMGLN
ncbi:hypothetical protein AB1A65_13725 [Muricauda sp. ANG21]|uniref:dihydrodipicolinate synthase family protein n=1 Tax=Allomuricauda sp. ANG21 TaxID=3042468 RepID=UPI0034573589